MGSMRQLASMIRYVHEAQAMGIAEDPHAQPPALAPGQPDIARAAREAESVVEFGEPAFPPS
jgi:hypothetical protein